MKKFEYKLQIAGLEEMVETINQELVELRAYKEGIKDGQKIDFTFSPTVNQAPKKDFAPGGFVGGVDHAKGDSKDSTSLIDPIKQNLSPELQAEIERLEKPNLEKLDENFKQQPFNQDSEIPIHEENRCYFQIENKQNDLLQILASRKKRELFYFLKDDDRQIKILESLADLKESLRLKKTLFWRWER